jgi:hypothetical protein
MIDGLDWYQSRPYAARYRVQTTQVILDLYVWAEHDVEFSVDPFLAS